MGDWLSWVGLPIFWKVSQVMVWSSSHCKAITKPCWTLSQSKTPQANYSEFQIVSLIFFLATHCNQVCWQWCCQNIAQLHYFWMVCTLYHHFLSHHIGFTMIKVHYVCKKLPATTMVAQGILQWPTNCSSINFLNLCYSAIWLIHDPESWIVPKHRKKLFNTYSDRTCSEFFICWDACNQNIHECRLNIDMVQLGEFFSFWPWAYHCHWPLSEMYTSTEGYNDDYSGKKEFWIMNEGFSAWYLSLFFLKVSVSQPTHDVCVCENLSSDVWTCTFLLELCTQK